MAEASSKPPSTPRNLVSTQSDSRCAEQMPPLALVLPMLTLLTVGGAPAEDTDAPEESCPAAPGGDGPAGSGSEQPNCSGQLSIARSRSSEQPASTRRRHSARLASVMQACPSS